MVGLRSHVGRISPHLSKNYAVSTRQQLRPNTDLFAVVMPLYNIFHHPAIEVRKVKRFSFAETMFMKSLRQNRSASPMALSRSPRFLVLPNILFSTKLLLDCSAYEISAVNPHIPHIVNRYMKLRS
ncbi:hypothetical protein AB6A40_000969 [Gnathostoma spinigerum]|uniref:Uncharacterized protein n=1 Tax=Gnathostoma spinigerum TaxID=75299 RepID=A0ABD6E450_9BILA